MEGEGAGSLPPGGWAAQDGRARWIPSGAGWGEGGVHEYIYRMNKQRQSVLWASGAALMGALGWAGWRRWRRETETPAYRVLATKGNVEVRRSEEHTSELQSPD